MSRRLTFCSIEVIRFFADIKYKMAEDPLYGGLYRVLGVSGVRPGNVFVRTRVTRKARKSVEEEGGGSPLQKGKKGKPEAKKERVDIVV